MKKPTLAEMKILLGSKELPVTMHPIEQREGNRLVNINPEAFDKAFQKNDWQYVGKEGQGGIEGRYKRFGDFVKEASSMRASNVAVNKNGSVVFGDGRHRYAYLRDQGLGSIPMSMDKESIEHAHKHGYLHKAEGGDVNPTPKQRALMMMQQQRQHFEQKAKEEAEYKSEMDKKYPRQQQSFEQWKAMRAKNAEPVHLAIGGQGPKNWMKGVEGVINPLKGPESPRYTHINDEGQAVGENYGRPMTEQELQALSADPMYARNKALNKWVESNLGNYIRKQMATPNDPIRKLAEEGIVHMAPEMMGTGQYLARGMEEPEYHRQRHGGERLGQSEAAKAWEDASDVSLGKTTVGDVLRMGKTSAGSHHVEPWMEKADPKTELFHPTDNMHAHYLGFDHIVDILKQDLAEGRIRPDQLNKISIEQAVRRAHEYNEERKKKMAETALKATEGMPVHKDYGNGYRWLELTSPKKVPENYTLPEGMKLDTIDHPRYGLLHTVSDPRGITHIEATNSPESALLRYYNQKGQEGYKALEDALKYEGDTMGHCVGGYCPAVANGSTRIFSLRDKKNEPHVTVETKPASETDYNLAINKLSGKDLENFIVEHQQQMLNNNMNATPAAHEAYKKLHGALPDRINQIKGKGNAKPVAKYIPYAQDFVKSGNWSGVEDLHNTDLHRAEQWVHPDTHEEYLKHGLQVPKYGTEEDFDAIHKQYQNLVNRRVAKGGIIHKAGGGATEGKPMNTPNLAQMRLHLTQRKNPDFMSNIGLNEALNISPAPFINPDPRGKGVPQVGGVAQNDGLPIGGTDENGQKPGMQLAPPAPPAPQQPGQQGQQQPQEGGGGSGPTPPMGNMLQMTPQGQAMSAMKPAGMAGGGSMKPNLAQMRLALAAGPQRFADGGQPEDTPYEKTKNPKRVLFKGNGFGDVQGIIVPRHMWHGGREKDGKRVLGMRDLNEARAQVYGPENRPPLSIQKVGRIHREILDNHFAKPLPEQLAAEEAALARLRQAKHINHNANTLDKSVKLDTVKHEFDPQGRSYEGVASKGVAGHSLYTSGHGENRKFHIINTCPAQTPDCGGGQDANGIVDTLNGGCFAPKSEAQYAAASVRRAAHEQAKHDPAMTGDWILAHTGSLREASEKTDRQKKRLLFRPNVVDETDVSSRDVIRHLNQQRAAKNKPPIISNQYAKTRELHDPENGNYVTYSNTGPKVKHGATVQDNVDRDGTRVRDTILAQDAGGNHFTNAQGNQTPPKGTYFVTDVRRHSPLSADMEKYITHAKYWTKGTPVNELRGAAKNSPDEGHYDGNGNETTEDKAHYGHMTFTGEDGIPRRYEYQRQHVLHPRLVNVPERKKNKETGVIETVQHMIPTDSRFLDENVLNKQLAQLGQERYKTKNGKIAGHILMTTPTESTTKLEHESGFNHHVNQQDIDHAIQNNGEYVVDDPLKQEMARGKTYVNPKEITLIKSRKKRKKFALGGHVVGHEEDPEMTDDDYLAFPERNGLTQRYQARRNDYQD
jgi:hypothetical protein